MDVPGVVVGAYLTTIFPKNALAGLCGFFIIAISLLLFKNRKSLLPVKGMEQSMFNRAWKRKKIDSSGQVFEYVIREPGLVLISSFCSGLVTGLAGLGGGITDTTTMILLGVPPHIAVASSEFAMALTNGTGLIAHGILKNILWSYAIPLTLGTILGAQAGVLAARHVKGETLRKVLSALAFILGVRLILLLFR